ALLRGYTQLPFSSNLFPEETSWPEHELWRNAVNTRVSTQVDSASWDEVLRAWGGPEYWDGLRGRLGESSDGAQESDRLWATLPPWLAADESLPSDLSSTIIEAVGPALAAATLLGQPESRASALVARLEELLGAPQPA